MKSKDVDTGFAMNCPSCGEALRIMFNDDGPELPAGVVVIFDGLPLVDARVDKCPFCGAVLDSEKEAWGLELDIWTARTAGTLKDVKPPSDFEPEDDEPPSVN